MRSRHHRSPLPTQWLMTDERLGRALLPAVLRLPRGSGIVFRHHATPPEARRLLFARLARVAARRGLVLVRAGTTPLPREQGVHGSGPRDRRPTLRTAAVHDLHEARAARRLGADLAFVSPVFATRSHPGAPTLGAARAAALARALPIPAIALGGVDAHRFARLHGFYGWAGIDAWLPGRIRRQKRKAVPT